ncbi:hypothetical protein [Cecembia sp.]|uniref:hypothetical protein n=1 Tax=Cecembia sp. TaxID=1898110 RepID=UPI0025BA3A9E|nr:hypothetical protein [Cecembia sp.]
MEENKKELAQIKWHQKRIIRFLGGILLLLLFFQAVFYFGSDLLLRNYLKEKVRVASEDKYEIDFDRVRILFLQRGFSFQGLSIRPLDETIASLDNIAYYSIEVPYISITGINYLFLKKEILLGKVKLSSPSIDFRLKYEDEELEDIEGDSPLEILQDEIKKSFLQSQISEIRINELDIDNADLLIKNFIAQRSIKAENSSLKVRDIQLLNDRDPATPFNAEGFYFEIENFELLLADSVHLIRAGELQVSSLEQYIRAQNLSIEPDFSKLSETYFQASLENLLLSDADINKVFYTSEVEVGKLMLQKPKFELFVGKGRIKEIDEEDVGTFDFYDLIDGILASIQIDQFDIEGGEFVQRNVAEPDQFRIRAERIDFNMSDFYVGPDVSKRANRFFYADQAKVELYTVDLFLADSLHQIRGEFVSLSSLEDKIRIEGFKLSPITETDTLRGVTLVEIDVPQLSITEANLKKIYNEGVIDVSEIKVENPEILLKDVQGKSGEDPGFDFPAFYAEYLDGIYVKKFEIEEGSLTVDNRLRIRQDSLSFGKVNLILENFAIDRQTETSDTKSFFWAENLQLDLQEYALKLSDNLHVFKADRVYLNTKTSEVSIDGFTIKPFNPGQIQSILDRYGRTTTLDIFVPRFTARGVDIKQAYFDEKLKVSSISVPSPKINIIRHKAATTDDTEESTDQREILDLLTSYFKEVQIGSLNLQKGTLNYENYVRERLRTFSEDNVSIAVKNFYISADTDPENLKFLFSEEVDLNLNNYVFNIADGKYNILADRINFNTAREEILATNVRLNPRLDFQDKTSVTAIIPEMSFRGVDLEAFLFDNTLTLEKVRLSESSVQVLINKDIAPQDRESVRQSRDRNLPKTIDIVNIDTIQADKAQFTLSFKEEGQEMELINTGVDISFYDFLLDSTKIAKGEIAGFFSSMALGIDEFWLTLNDSVHQVTFSKVELDTRYEGILLNNFRIIPRTLSGKPGKPVFSGHIPTALIKTNSLAELQGNKDLWIKELRLFRPDIEIFVDQLSPEPSDGAENQIDIQNFLIETLQLDEFEVIEGHFVFFQKDGSKKPTEISDVNFAIQDIKFNMEEIADLSPNMLLEKDFEFSFPNFKLLLEDSLNMVSIGLVAINNKEIILSDVVYEPRFGKYEYYRKVGHQTDVARIYVPEIRIVKPDLALFLDNEILKADQILISDVDGDFFRDKRFERPEGIFRPMPQVLMVNSALRLEVDTLKIQNGKVLYMEFPEKGMVPGEIYFSNLNVSMAPFHLGKSGETYALEEVKLLAEGKINGEAEIALQGDMFFTAPYPMLIKAQLGAFDLDLINSILKSNAFVRVRAGRVNGAEWSFTADNREAIGQMKILYSDLNLEILEERTLLRGRGRKSILTFVLNAFAVRSNNPRKLFNTTITSKIYHPRDKDRFIFNYWWRATLTGLQGSVGLGQPKIPKRKEDEE